MEILALKRAISNLSISLCRRNNFTYCFLKFCFLLYFRSTGEKTNWSASRHTHVKDADCQVCKPKGAVLLCTHAESLINCITTQPQDYNEYLACISFGMHLKLYLMRKGNETLNLTASVMILNWYSSWTRILCHSKETVYVFLIFFFLTVLASMQGHYHLKNSWCDSLQCL